jgi:hypothetical protein
MLRLGLQGCKEKKIQFQTSLILSLINQDRPKIEAGRKDAIEMCLIGQTKLGILKVN